MSVKNERKDWYQRKLDDWASCGPLESHVSDVRRLEIARRLLTEEQCPNGCGGMCGWMVYEGGMTEWLCPVCEFSLKKSAHVANVYANGEGSRPKGFAFGKGE